MYIKKKKTKPVCEGENIINYILWKSDFGNRKEL